MHEVATIYKLTIKPIFTNHTFGQFIDYMKAAVALYCLVDSYQHFGGGGYLRNSIFRTEE
jgi:hypothetical protein